MNKQIYTNEICLKLCTFDKYINNIKKKEMKVMNLTGILKMEMQETEIPEIMNDNDVLIKMKVVAVCGSDIHYYTDGKIGSKVVNYPFPVGHECAGIVEKTGKAVTKVKPGDRIAIEPAISCGVCDQCINGRPHTCRSLRFLGCPGQAEGSMAEYIVMPEECCFPIPDHMSLDEAALSEPLSIGVYAVKRSIPMQDAKIGILGYGPIGMSVMLAAKSKGGKNFYVTDKIDERLNIATKEGAMIASNRVKEDSIEKILDAEPLGMDVVFECCGQQETLEDAIALLKPGGTVMIIGIPSFEKWQITADLARSKEITFVNVRRQNHCVQEAIDLIANKIIDLGRMPTHYFSFAESKKAFDLVHNYEDGVMKAIIRF
ncbi:MAG: alcohol dehydrogenase catalytic domain-containing protein [Bacteroidales bacterium]|nr:alcohol dehydrogenase catalytic domain-containing protein [Bacteroidales bacterium]